MNPITLSWNASFKTGYTRIDQQHEKLFKLIQNFAYAYAQKRDKEIITDLLFELEDYVQQHFAEEEIILAKKEGLPSETHLNQHAEFLDYLKTLKFDYVSYNKPIGEDLFNFLISWLQDHILGIDSKELTLVKSKY